MKRDDSGDFCMLYVEPTDDKGNLFEVIGGQKKPVVIMLPVQSKTGMFQRPEDFGDLKHVKRQLDVPIIFVISGNERLRQVATRNGFPTYRSIDALSEALSQGQLSLSRQRTLTKPLSPNPPEGDISSRKTGPLIPLQQNVSRKADRASTRSAPTMTRNDHQHSSRAGKRRGLPVVLVVLSLLVLGGTGLGSFLLLFHNVPALGAVNRATTGQIVGHIYFLSSEQLSEDSSQGIDDEVQIDLHNLSNPAPGKCYYGWLLRDENLGEANSTFLGKLPVNNGNVDMLYTGDAQHTNLLEIDSRFLITEEDAVITPITPSPDYSTWRYYAEFPQSPNRADTNHYSFLDHLRHLLATDPTLNALEMPGGLNTWLYRNTGKLLEWVTSARDNWEESKDLAFIRRQTIRTLTYLDGLSFVQQDIPLNTSLPDTSRLASVGLLDMNGANQNPPSYLYHIIYHLNGLISSPGASPGLREQAAQIISALSNVRQWLETMRADTRRIVAMMDDQLSQPPALALLNEIVDLANRAYTGNIDPTTNEVQEGVTWIHDHLQSLATLGVAQYVASNSSPEIIPATEQPLADESLLAALRSLQPADCAAVAALAAYY